MNEYAEVITNSCNMLDRNIMITSITETEDPTV